MRILTMMVFLAGAIITPILTHAQSVEPYLKDTADAAIRVELIAPPEIIAQEQTFLGKIKEFLGIRAITRIKPEPGTKLLVQSSAYASSPYQTDSTPCITAAGTRVRPGVVASNFLPLGTILDVNGEEYIVEDRMNPRYNGYYLDIWYPSTRSALEHGRRKLEITIVGYGKPGDPIREESEIESSGAGQSETSNIVDDPNIGVWTRIVQNLSSITQLLSTRPSGDVNRFDVDCLSTK